jgi:hypothetical protein
MTLCLAQSLIASKGIFNPQAAIRNYIKWYENGYLSATDECFDIGGGTRRALMIWKHYFDRSGHIREDDPNGHEGGQPEIDRALKREVSAWSQETGDTILMVVDVLWKRLPYARCTHWACVFPGHGHGIVQRCSFLKCHSSLPNMCRVLPDLYQTHCAHYEWR